MIGALGEDVVHGFGSQKESRAFSDRVAISGQVIPEQGMGLNGFELVILRAALGVDAEHCRETFDNR